MSDWWSGAGDIKLVDCDDDDDDEDADAALDAAAGRRYKVVFRLYAASQSDIDAVIAEIDELGKEAVSASASSSSSSSSQSTSLMSPAPDHQSDMRVVNVNTLYTGL